MRPLVVAASFIPFLSPDLGCLTPSLSLSLSLPHITFKHVSHSVAQHIQHLCTFPMMAILNYLFFAAGLWSQRQNKTFFFSRISFEWPPSVY